MRAKLLSPRVGIIVALLAAVGLLVPWVSVPALASVMLANPTAIWAATPTPIAEQEARRAILQTVELTSFPRPARDEINVPAINMQDGWAFAAISYADVLSREVAPRDPDYVLAHLTAEGEWVAMLPGRPLWNTWIDQAPTEIFPLGFKELYANYPASASSITAAGYNLPWINGEKGTVTTAPQTTGHIDQIDFDLWKNSLVSNSGDVAAAKGGKIKFAKDSSTTTCELRGSQWYYKGTSTLCPWTEANLVVVEHATNEYSYYLHIAPGTIPSSLKITGAAVAAGQKIGEEGNTGWSTGIHLHFFIGDVYAVGSSGMPWDNSPIQVEFSNDNTTLYYSDFWRGGEITAKYGSSGGSCAAPSLTAPNDGETLTNPTITFRWNALSGCTFNGYTFRIKDTSNMDSGGTTIIDTGEGGTQRTETISDRDNQDLWWGMKAANAPNGADWSVRRFRISPPQPPVVPSLSSPGNGSSYIYNYDLNFQWNDVSGATEYLVEWWGGPYSTMQPCGWSSSTSCHIGQVTPGNTYSWHVKARNGAGESGWSSTWTFTIQPRCYALTRTHTGSGGDPIASPANSNGCPAGQYVDGTVISLAAAPASGWRVASWSGASNDSSISTTNSLIMQAGNRTVGVNYTELGIELVEPLQLTPSNPLAGELVTATATIQNMADRPLTLTSLYVGAQGPNCTDFTCSQADATKWGDFPAVQNLTLQPGERFTYTKSRLWLQEGPQYIAQLMYLGGPDDWHTLGSLMTYNVGRGLQVASGLRLTPAAPVAGQTYTATFTLTNAGPRELVLPMVGIGGRDAECSGNNCTDAGMTAFRDVRIPAGGYYTYVASRSLDRPGRYYIEPSIMAAAPDWWLPLTGLINGQRIIFTVARNAGTSIIYLPLIRR